MISATRIALLVTVSTLFAAGAPVRAQQSPPASTVQKLAAKIPTNVKQAILDSLNASNSPTADDRQGGFHEEGGLWVTTKEGDVVAEPLIPGNYAKPGQRARMAFEPARPLPSTSIAAVRGVWHVHPAGEIVNQRVLPPKREGNKKIVTTITTTTYFEQPPSDEDISTALLPVNIVIGARSRLAYFYDRSGIIGTMPLDEFLAPLQLPAVATSAAQGKKPHPEHR